MPSYRIPGPLSANNFEVCGIDDGTLVRARSAAPGPIGNAARFNQDDLADRFVIVLTRTLPLLPGELQGEFAQLLSPASLGIMAATLAIWAGSHYFGVGFFADALLLAVGGIMLGAQVWQAAADFVGAMKSTVSAQADADLDTAARQLARFITIVGVGVFTVLVFKGAKRMSPKIAQRLKGEAPVAIIAGAAENGGLTAAHFQVFKQVAREQNRIIAVRFTNRMSTHWIERGFPAKPLQIKIKTSRSTGIVTAVNAEEIQFARGQGYFVIDVDGVPRGSHGKRLDFNGSPEWPLETGQVIHPQQRKPLVGDYDLLGVINPEAKGRNIQLAASGGKTLDNWTNPDTNRVAAALNARMDQPRIMHGQDDGFHALGALKAEEGAVVFFPDSEPRLLNTRAEIEKFYQEIGRKAIGDISGYGNPTDQIPSADSNTGNVIHVDFKNKQRN